MTKNKNNEKQNILRYVRLTDQLLFKNKFRKGGSKPNESIYVIWG